MKNQTNSIRSITRNDIVSVERLELELQGEFAWNKNKIEDALSSRSICLGLFKEENKLIGYVICPYVLDEAEIHIIGVSKQYQKQGYAGQLLNELFNQLKQKNIHTVFLEVRASNTSAIALYRKFDFKQVGKRKNYYKSLSDANTTEDALIYKKLINPLLRHKA